MSRQIGLIGLGLVGKALVKRLTGAGYAVLAYDISPQAREDARVLGAETAPHSGAVAATGGTLLISLPDSDVVSEVLLGPNGIAKWFPAGSLVIDTTTGRPSDAVANARALEDQGVRFVDCTLSGSSEDIAEGRATALVGDGAWSRNRKLEPDYLPLVQAFAANVFCVGPAGSGCLSKLIVNLVMGLNRAALAEGLAFGLGAGLDGETLLEVLSESAAYSRVLDMKGRRMLERNYAPASRVAQHAKDVRLILEEGERVGVDLPLERVHAQLLESLVARGLGDLDNAALIEAYRKAGTETP
ncbi:MAG: NAD(P)-dependent oxidoreductase [Acidobacteriota bacterium]|nr:NAD(P)-dependent oxidoreductase [Acidobacteriota bacterium]